MAYLYFLSGPYSGKRAHLRAKRITVGRAEGNKLLIEDESVSPKHFILSRSGDDYFVDIGETRAPLAVNGKQVLDAKLADGDTLQIGAVLAQFFTETARPADDPHPLDFWAEPGRSNEVEVFSLDDAEELPPLPPSGDRSRAADSGVRAKVDSKSGEHSDRARSPDRARLPSDDSARVRSPDRARTGSRRPPRRNRKKALIAFCFLVLMLTGSAFAFRKDIWKEPAKPVAQTEIKVEEPPTEGPIERGPIEPPVPKVPVLAALPVGVGPSGLKVEGKIHRARSFKSHQEAVDAAQPGDAVIFDSIDAKPIVVQRPLVDIQFLSGSATWELHADLVDCQFLYHETRQFIQRAGKLQRCVFFRCPIKHTDLIHADAVSFYFDERSPLHPKDNPDGGKSPTLLLTGFVRDVLIHRPLFGSATSDRRFDMKWLPSIRIHATDPEGDGRGTYIMNPVVLGQRAWTPIQISRGKGITIAHITTDGNAWADPVFEILRGDDCVILCTSFGSETPTTVEAYTQPPTKLKYHDHEEFGYSNGPAYRGALGTIIGMRNRIVAHGDTRKPYTVNRKMTLPGLHYADGIVAVDPYIQQFATERGGLGINFAEHRGTFVMLPAAGGAEFLSSQQQMDGTPMYPREGPLMHKPTFVPLKDLRINAGEFDKLPLVDMTGKPIPEIEKALIADKSVFLGPGTYEFKQTLRSGFVVGAGMEATILKWPADTDCAQRNCRGIINCTVSGGRYGYNSQAGTGNRLGNPNGLFLRTRFENQKEAGINVHTSQFQTWQDCEFVGQRVGFGNGFDKGAGVFKGDKGPSGGITIDNLNIVNCSFRKIRHRAVDLTPDSRQLGHVGIHNCSFEDTAETALRIDGGQTHLVQLCRFRHCANSTYAPAMSIVSHGVVALSHLEIDCSVVKGNPLCISLKGLAAVSNCTIRGMAASIKSDGLLAVDRIDADGNVQAPKDSLLARSKFKNMALPEGTALVRGDSFADVTGVSFALVDDKTPPSEVLGQRVRTVGKQRRLDWKTGEDPESGIAGYLITAEGKEIARVPLQYDSPSDLHSPLIKPPLPTAFLDSNLANKMYDVVPINGMGIMADGKEATTRRIGPARARFLDQGEPFVIKDFVNVKGKITIVVDEEGKKLPPTKVGISGMPNSVYFEWGKLVEAP